MIEFVKDFDARVEDERSRAPAIVESAELAAKTRIINAFDTAIHTIEYNLAEEGMVLDTETDDAFAVIKHKLATLKDAL